MSNNPILPIVPNGAGPLDGTPATDEDELPAEDPTLDEGETNDDQNTVEKDVDEATSVNDNLNK